MPDQSHHRGEHSHQSHHQRFLEHTHHHRHVRYHVPKNLDQDQTVKTYRLIGYTLATIVAAAFIGYIAYTFVYLANQKPREELETHLNNRKMLLAGDNPADAYNNIVEAEEFQEDQDESGEWEDDTGDQSDPKEITTNTWKTYTNERLGFSIRHPEQMGVIEGISNPAGSPGEHVLLHNPITGDKVNVHVQGFFTRPLETTTLFEYEEMEVEGYPAIKVLFTGLSSVTRHEIHVLKDSDLWNLSGSVLDDDQKVENLARVKLIIDSFQLLDE